jgi:hypothetical protein
LEVTEEVAPPPADQRAPFYALSATLTGFGTVELQATGVGDSYLAFLMRLFPEVTAELLEVWELIEQRHPPQRREKGLKEKVLDDERLGPIARSLLQLWYTGAWPPMTDEWNKENAGTEEDRHNSLLAVGYPQGLVWRTAHGIHPQAVRPTGFGSWAEPPGGS